MEKGTTRVVHCKHESYDIYIGRPSMWGNPFILGKDGDRDEVIRKYREYILRNPYLLDRLGELAGQTLGCWCKPRACHGDVLVELLNSMTVQVHGGEVVYAEDSQDDEN